MALASEPNELEDLVTCPVCLGEFDSIVDVRKPKFLPCSHTLCLQCVKEILVMSSQQTTVTCPLCRKVSEITGEAGQLPNNPYALYMLSMKAKKSMKDNLQKLSKVKNWCFTCGTVGGSECSSNHTTTDSTSSKLSCLKELLTLKEDNLKMRESIIPKLEEAIKKKKEFGCYMTLILEGLKSLELDMEKLEGVNNATVAKLSSLLESYSNSTSGFKEMENDNFLVELFTLADSPQPEETLQLLKDKSSENSFKEIEEKLVSHTKEIEHAEMVAKTRVLIQLFDQNNVAVPNKAPSFISQWKAPSCKADHLLLSHLSVARAMQFPAVPASPTPTACPPSAHSTSAPPPVTKTQPALATSMPCPPSSHLNSARPLGLFNPPLPTSLPRPRLPLFHPTPQTPCVSLAQTGTNGTKLATDPTFIITVKQHRVILGEISIQPGVGQITPFVQKLGQHCLKSPKAFQHTIQKAVQLTFVILPLAIDGFNVPKDIPSGPLARKPLDVGLMKLTEAGPNNQPAATWALIFVLERFRNPKYAMHLKTLRPAILVGHVVGGSDVLTHLSDSNASSRSSYRFSLEFK